MNADRGHNDGSNAPPGGSRPVTLGEVHFVLTGRLKETKYRQSPQAAEVIQQSYDYSNMFAKFKGAAATRELRDRFQDTPLDQREKTALINLLPRSVEEAQSLVPSLSRLPEHTIQTILEELEAALERQ